MTISMITPTAGDIVTLVDGDGDATENFTIVESVIMPYIEGIFEIEDRDGERYMITRYPIMDTLTNKGWIEITPEDE